MQKISPMLSVQFISSYTLVTISSIQVLSFPFRAHFPNSREPLTYLYSKGSFCLF